MSKSCAATRVSDHNAWLPTEFRIVARRNELADVFTLELAGPEPFRFAPGQFNMLYVPGFGEAAISISSDSDRPERFQHTIRVVGNVTRRLQKFSSGDRLFLRGPFGTGWPIDRCPSRDVVIACGGLGLAPLRPVIYYLLHRRSQFGAIHLLYGARTPRDLLYAEEFAVWQSQGIEVRVTIDRGDESWRGAIGVVTQLMKPLRWRPESTMVLTCGPEVMMRFVAQEALAQQVRPDHVFLSMERNMNCAVGWCGHCQLGPSFVCKDGPVYTYAQIEPFLYVEDL